MAMRHSLIAACLAATALFPVQALARAEAGSGAGAMAERLSDPATQIAVTAMLSTLAQSVLDLDIGPLARAMEGAGVHSDLPSDARVGDVVGPETARTPEEIARRTPRMMTAMAGMAGAVDEMMPQLRAMAERMRDAVPHQ